MFGKRLIQVMVSVFMGGMMALVFLWAAHSTRARSLIDNHFQNEAQMISSTQQDIYLPIVFNQYPWYNPFGVEIFGMMPSGSIVFSRTINLPAGWVRLNDRISWRSLQPNEGDPIAWDQLAGFEDELRRLNRAQITPIVIVDDYPRWATDNTVRQDGQPTSCGPLRSDKVDAFATFTRSLVARYKSSEFNVHVWELGNEPDVDPDLVIADSIFGCWGNIDDPYYGGERYGNMVKTVSQAIKAEDPSAKVWIGGLLLNAPQVSEPAPNGHPEKFLEGILLAGAAPYFDVVPYHWYAQMGVNATIDFDLGTVNNPWRSWGGGTVGKARFLRQVMQRYGVDKPVFLDETAMGCPEGYSWCNPPGDYFYNLQADYVVRTLTRGLNDGIMGFTWYTVDGPGWRNGGLLDGSGGPKPVYLTYQHLLSRLRGSRLIGPVDYGTGLEAYAFETSSRRLSIVWAIENITKTITIPQSSFVTAYTRSGQVITPTVSGSDFALDVGYSPIYIVRNP